MRRHTSGSGRTLCYQTHALKEAVGIHALKVPLAYAGVCVCIRQHPKHIKRMRLKRQSGYMLLKCHLTQMLFKKKKKEAVDGCAPRSGPVSARGNAEPRYFLFYFFYFDCAKGALVRLLHNRHAHTYAHTHARKHRTHTHAHIH